MAKATVRIVRTPEGAKKYGVPIGSVIIKDAHGKLHVTKKGNGKTAPSSAEISSAQKQAAQGQYNTLGSTKKVTSGLSVKADAAPKPKAPAKSSGTKMPDAERQARAKAVAHETIGQAKANEPAVSKVLQDVVKNTPGAKLEGFDFRIKTASSLEPKIVKKSQERSITPEKYKEDIGDALRYTMVAEPKSLVAAAKKALSDLEGKGHKVVSIDNSWQDGNAYKGINVAMQTPDGLTWELQFHTPTSFDKKSDNHGDYEIYRDPSKSPVERWKAFQRMLQSWDGVDFPEGWEGFGSQKLYPPMKKPQEVKDAEAKGVQLSYAVDQLRDVLSTW